MVDCKSESDSDSSKFSVKDKLDKEALNVLTWHNVTVTPPVKNKILGVKRSYSHDQLKYRNILDNVSGYAKSGCLTALMGPSGSGKTTLLNFLSKRIGTYFGKSGLILLNNEPVKIKKISCYIKQEDIFYTNVTVEEHLLFNATLRLSKTHSSTEIKDVVNQLLIKFQMEEKRYNRITETDTSIKGLSGGQRRRITIMTELLVNPLIIFADEPTTGLDSYLADSIVQILKDLANDGHIVICTIHQPTSLSFSMFDDLALISKGLPIYMGAIEECTEYLANIGYNCPENFSLSDFFIRLVSIDPLNVDDSYNQINFISQQFRKKHTISFDENVKEQELENYKKKKSIGHKMLKTLQWPDYNASFLVQFRLLTTRTIKSLLRQPVLLFYKFLQEAIVGFVIGICFSQARYTVRYAAWYNGLLFFETTAFSLNAILAATISIPNEFDIFAKEHRSKLYPSGLYFLAKTFGELPMQLIQSLVVAILIYFIANLRPGAGFFLLHFVILALSYQCALSFGYLISCIAGNSTSALALTTPFMLPFLLFGGFLLKEKFIPPYFIWVRWISWMVYTFESFVIINSKGGQLLCDTNECIDNGIKYKPADILMDGYVIRQDFFKYNVILIIGLVITYRILAIIILVLKIRYKDRTQQI